MRKKILSDSFGAIVPNCVYIGPVFNLECKGEYSQSTPTELCVDISHFFFSLYTRQGRRVGDWVGGGFGNCPKVFSYPSHSSM